MLLTTRLSETLVLHGHRAAWAHHAPGREIVFAIARAQSADAVTMAYADFVNARLETPDGKFLFGFSAADLADRGAWITAAYLVRRPAPAELVGARHIHLDGDGMLWFRGAYVARQHRGRRLGPALAALGIAHIRRLGHAPEAAIGAAIVENGVPNQNSVRAMAKLGFTLTDAGGATFLDGSYRDRHLLAGAERIEGRPAIRYRKMVLPAERFGPAIRRFESWGH